MLKFYLVLLLLVFMLQDSALADYTHYKLNNGLNVYLEENHSLPIVNVTILYKVGCSDEYNSITGISHMLEHMNFRGSKHFKDGFIDELVSRYGGASNAQTSFDYTVYFTTISSKALKKVLAFYADNMNNLLFNKSKFIKERDVVYQERLWRIDDSANGFLYYRLHNIAYIASPYRWTPIGFAYDIQHYTVGELEDYYHKYYTPNNAILVVSGDINSISDFNLIKRLFNDKRFKPIIRHITKEPEQLGRRIAYVKKPAQFKKIAMAFRIPSVYSKDTPVLDLISFMLFGGKTAVMYNDLVRKKHIFTDIDGGNESRIWDSGLFEIFGDIAKGRSFIQARIAILAELNKIKEGKFSHLMLEIAKEKAEMSYILSQQTLVGRDRNEAYYAAFNLLHYYENYIKIIDRINREEIVVAADKYFKHESETDCFLVPAKGYRGRNFMFRGNLR